MSQTESAARNKQNYLSAKRAFNRGDMDGCMAFYALDHQIRSSETGSGREHIRNFLDSMHAIWGDLKIIPQHVVAEDDWVMGHCLSSGIHSRPVMGVEASFRRIEAAFWDLHRFNSEGLIVETWNLADGLAIRQQLAAAIA